MSTGHTVGGPPARGSAERQTGVGLAGVGRPGLVAVGALAGAALGPWVQQRAGSATEAAATLAVGAGAAVAVGAWRRRAVGALAGAVGVLALGLSLRALIPLDTLGPGRLEGTVAVRSDPTPGLGGGTELIVAHDGRRLLASIDPPGAGEVAGVQVGDSMRVDGSGCAAGVADGLAQVPAPCRRAERADGG